MRSLITTVYILFSSLLVFAQQSETGIPKITNYPPKVYGFESQNYSVEMDDNGFMYFGNLNGILVFDGTEWALIDMQGGPSLAKTVLGDIYAASYKNFGYIKKDKNKDIFFHSISDEFPDKFNNIKHIINIKSLGKDIIIQTEKKLYLWHNDLFLIDYNNAGYNLFKVDTALYVDKIGYGIYKYKASSIQAFSENAIFKNNKIESILAYSKNKLLIKLKNKNFLILNKGNISPFRTESDYFFSNTNIVTSSKLSNNEFLYGTERCGIVLLNKQGKLICNIKKESGLLDDNINNIFIDKINKHVWLATENGISRVDMPNTFTFYGRYSGLGGSIRDIIRFNNSIYVSTSQGVFKLLNKKIFNINKKCYSNKKFELIQNLSVNAYKLYAINKHLYATTKEGLFEIKENNFADKLFDGNFEKIINIKSDTNSILISSVKGVLLAKWENNNIVKKGYIKGFSCIIRTLAEDERGIIWAGSDNDGLYRILFKDSISTNAQITSITKGLGLPDNFNWIDVYNTRNGVVFSTFKGVYKFNLNFNKFYRDTLIGFDSLNTNTWIFPIKEDNNGNLWFSSGKHKVFKKNTGVALYNKNKKSYNIIFSPFNIISDITIESIYTDKDSIVWFGTNNNLIRVDMKSLNEESSIPRVFFKNITVDDSTVFNFIHTEQINYNSNKIPIYKYSQNTIEFAFTSPDYKSNEEIQYQYILEGYDKNWSEWDNENYKEYTNLPEGNYTFRIISKDILDNISEQLVYKFRIKPPVYRTWYAYLLYLILLASFIIMIIRYRSFLYEKEKQLLEHEIAEKTEEVVRQKEKAEMLIRKLLPEDTAKEIQTAGRAKRKKYEMVTVLFSDIQGFTKIAEHMPSETLLNELDRLFLKFDELVEIQRVEKIKTIGDAYMCAGGIPRKNLTNAIDVVMVAIKMREFMTDLKKEALNDWEVRIGIHTGPVIAGVIGNKKLSYDIWGDTVNIASRMESSGIPGEINISEATYSSISEFFECEHRGKLPVKYKGEIDMYFVIGIRKEYSINGEGKIPNKKFMLRYQQIRFRELEDVVYYKLEHALNEDIKYHDLKHTVDVVNQVEVIGNGEKINAEEMIVLKTAALLHDLGFVLGYNDHEESGVKLAKELLPDYGYTSAQIKTITELIYATKFPPKPENKLEEIICDADLDYLGRPDFLPVSIKLYEELFKFKQIEGTKDWNELQVKFLETHHYYTKTAQKMREVNKKIQLEKIKQWLAENNS